jgi:hypothetical protein
VAAAARRLLVRDRDAHLVDALREPVADDVVGAADGAEPLDARVHGGCRRS